MFKQSFIKLACINPIVEVGLPLVNAKEIVNALKKSKASINLFPELATTGYSCGDLFFHEDLMAENYEAIEYIVKNNPSKGIVVFGAPLELTGSLFNCAIVLKEHEILGVIPKMHLPNYNEFSEKRWFQQGLDTTETKIVINGQTYPFGNVVFKDYKNQLSIGVEICEDMWSPITPGSFLSLCGVNVMLNLSSSNEYFNKDETRRICVMDNSRRNTVVYAYSSSSVTESTAETVFSGHNVIASCGNLLKNDLSFDPQTHYTYCDVDLGEVNYNRKTSTNLHVSLPKDYVYVTVEFTLGETDYEFEQELDRLPFVPEGDLEENFKKIANILEYSLYKRMKHTNLKTLVIGVSGGLDSTLALLVAHRAFTLLGYDHKNIIGVSMPGLGTSNRTKNNAKELMEKLGITYLEKSINDEVLSHFNLIEHDPNITDITFENTQARYRTMVLMNLANKHHGLVLGTGDMSELALGWCTYNGDQMSMYGINAGMPKTLVRYMTYAYSVYVFNNVSDILNDIIDTPISPELKPNQITEESVGKYEINDFILYRLLFCGDSKERTIWLLSKAFEISNKEACEYVNNFHRRFYTQQFKRQSLPEGPKVLRMSLSPRSGFKIPSDLSRR